MNIHPTTERTAATGITVETAAFLGLSDVGHIRREARLGLTDHSYLPKASDPRSDWVASVAAPAFRAVAAAGVPVRAFCTIGTGAGLDALAAIEIFDPSTVAITDLHEDVVQQARANVLNNIVGADRTLIAGAGDLLLPIRDRCPPLDLIYENLPNIPLGDGDDLEDGQVSSTFIADREEAVPEFARRYLMALHYVALRQAHPMLAEGGRVLSSIGGRIPFEAILRLGREAGYESDILTLTWKTQSEPDEVIGGYQAWEHQGLGPFRFYARAVLERVFAELTPVEAAAQAFEVERTLLRHSLSADQALQLYRDGGKIGHTVAVLQSRKI